MSVQEEKKELYSYHTFIFPFIWNHSGKITRGKFEKYIHPYWEPELRCDQFDPQKYAQYCYFNQAARNAIFTEAGDRNPIVRNFRFNVDKLCQNGSWLDSDKDHTNPVKYIIKKNAGKDGGHAFVATLNVNNIRLRLFNTGVGMIVFELENYDKNTEQDINLINEYGRRVFMPFVADGGCKLCADTITLQYPGGEMVSTFSGKNLKGNSDIRFMELIMYLLRNDKYEATTSLKLKQNQIRIEPIIDDRMFVSCVWMNNDFALRMLQFDKEQKEYRYLVDALDMEPNADSSAARQLYELLFVDGDGLSCRSRTMLRKMLEEHVYTRWLEYSSEYGTIAGMTEYSMITVSTDPVAVNAHLMEYTEMVMLVLAQRATLLAFERQISDCARGKLPVNKVQRAYVDFQSKYLLREVTPQQQGMEMYNLLLKNLFIDTMQGDLEKQINALFSAERNSIEWSDNLILLCLAVLGIVDAIAWLFDGPDCVEFIVAVGLMVAFAAKFWHNHNKRFK